MVKPHTSQAVASISDPDRSEQMGANRNSPRNNPIIASPNTTCPCGNPIILDGLVVKAHWEGKVCQDCESEMFKKHEARFRGAFGPRPVENSELREAMDWLSLLARPVVGARRGSPAYQQSRNAALLLTEILRLRAIGEVR